MTAKQFKFGLGILVVAACVVMLIVTGLQETSLYYVTVAQQEAREAAEILNFERAADLRDRINELRGQLDKG